MPKRIGGYIWYWAPAVAWMGLIFYFSSQSVVPRVDITNIDKFFHFIEYFILGFLLARALGRTSSAPNYRNIFFLALLIASVYGASDEFHQKFVPGRCCDLFDLIADIIGSGAGAWLSVFKESLPSGRQG